MSRLRRHRLGRSVVRSARTLLEQDLVVSTAGNVSVREEPARFLITPTRRDYRSLRPRDLVAVDLGAPISGRPSREWPLHAEIYSRRAEVGAIVHTHSTAATAWSFLGRALDLDSEERAYFAVGRVECAPPLPAGSPELARAGADALGAGEAALLGRHGVVAVGDTLERAMVVGAVVERQAAIALALCQIGWDIPTAPEATAPAADRRLEAVRAKE